MSAMECNDDCLLPEIPYTPIGFKRPVFEPPLKSVANLKQNNTVKPKQKLIRKSKAAVEVKSKSLKPTSFTLPTNKYMKGKLPTPRLLDYSPVISTSKSTISKESSKQDCRTGYIY